jgi:hypothetical protein
MNGHSELELLHPQACLELARTRRATAGDVGGQRVHGEAMARAIGAGR